MARSEQTGAEFMNGDNSQPSSSVLSARKVNELSAIVVMGPSGCGKSTLAKALAKTIGWNFVEGDEHHPAANIAKMEIGEPLTDMDRLPFLKSIGRELISAAPAVASCSALRRSYRDILRSFVEDILFVWPKLENEELERRMTERGEHFMPSDLLCSQISCLEPCFADESCLILDGKLPTAEQIKLVLTYVSALQS